MTIFNTTLRPGGRVSRGMRRGNSIILVVGLIVLLLIIAISFITRAQGVRSTAAAYRDASVHDGAGDAIAGHIANNVANSLFVEKIDPLDENGVAVIGPVDEDLRIKADDSQSRYGVDPNFNWNYAPWSVVPWTNPPDWLTYPNKAGLQNEFYYAGIGQDALNPAVWNDSLFTGPILTSRQNPRGGPGTSDTRWLRDLEPQRQSTQRDIDGNEDNGYDAQYADGFSHWRHLTNLSRPNNEWRIVRDIADVTGVRSGASTWDQNLEMSKRGNWSWGGGWEVSSIDGHHYHGGLVERLDVPVEQWPSQPPTNDQGELLNGEKTDGFDSIDSGQNAFTNPEDFWSRWMRWFDPEGYRDAMLAAAGNPGSSNFPSGYDWPVGNQIPQNFYDLSDLDGDGTDGEYYDPDIDGKLGEKPEDEFRKGTARWHVGRVLTDTDGDGFTDSFWWQSPHMSPTGLRQVIGVSVTDNAGRLNANVATRFVRNDSESGVPQEGTRGSTPADLALMGQGTPPFEFPWENEDAGSSAFLQPNGVVNDIWSVGFFDNRENWSGLLTSDTYSDLSPLNGYNKDWLLYPDVIDEENGGATDPEVYVGFNPENFTGSGTLQDLLSELNIEYNGVFPDSDSGRDINDRDNRLFYFQEAGLEPFSPGGFFTPMGISEELELRAYEGNNLPWLYGRFEQPINAEWSKDPFSNEFETSFLRSGQDRVEVSASGEQLDNRQLLADNRRKLTFFNSTRNDTLPPWLWLENRVGRVSLSDTLRRSRIYEVNPDPSLLDVDSDGLADEGFPRFVPYARDMLEQLPVRTLVNDSGFWTPASINSPAEKETWQDYFEQSREKIDLREWEKPLPRQLFSANTLPPGDAYQGLSFSNRLPLALLTALTSGDIRDSWKSRYDFGDANGQFATTQDVLDYAAQSPRETGDGGGVILRENPPGSNTSFFADRPRGYSGDINFEEARQTAAMFAANIQSWRDPDVDSPLYSMGWFDSNGQPRGNIGAVDLPRLDGWELNTDTQDPFYNSDYQDWRPAVEDMFIDAHGDDSNPLVFDQATYATSYQPFDSAVVAGACFFNGSCVGGLLTIDACRAQGPGAKFFPGLDCTDLADVRHFGSCCFDSTQNSGLLTCQEWQTGGVMNFRQCTNIQGRWIPDIACSDLDCSQYESLSTLPLNVESPFRGDDFDGFGYPRLFDATIANDSVDQYVNLADPFRNASSSAGANSSGNYVDLSDGYSQAELNTRASVRNVRALGMEPQPFITEAFVTHVVRPTRIPNAGVSDNDQATPGYLEGGYEYRYFPTGSTAADFEEEGGVWSDQNPMWLVVEGSRSTGLLEPISDDLTPADYDSPAGTGYMPDPRPADTVAVVQISNPYDQPIPLFDKVVANGQVQWLPRYKIRLFGQEFPLSPSINPVTEGRVSSLRGLIDAGTDADGLQAGLLQDQQTGSVNFNTKHGMVLPPATHDRPYTLTIVSVPAAREDDFDDERKRWSFFMEDGNANTRGELDQWIDFLDLGLNNGITGNDPSGGLLSQQSFEFEGETYDVAQSDLIWIVRPAIDPEGDGAFDPGAASDDWDREENDDVRELWSTNRLYYDGLTDPWTQFTNDEDLFVPYAWNAEDSNGDYIENRSFLSPTLINGTTTWSPKNASVELVKVDRLDFNDDLNYNRIDRDPSITLPSNLQYQLRYEYGDEPFNPATGAFSLLFENSNGGYPAQEIVIDRTLQQRDDGIWHDPLMEAVVGLEWGQSYPSAPGTWPGQPQSSAVIDPASIFGGSLAAGRLPSLAQAPAQFDPWVEWEVGESKDWEDGNTDQEWSDSEFLAGQAINPVVWNRKSSAVSKSSIGLGQSFNEVSGFIPGNTDGGGQGAQADFPLWPRNAADSTADYRDAKAQSARFSQWARYARPWGLDPDWPSTSNGSPLEFDLFTGGNSVLDPKDFSNNQFAETLGVPQRQLEYAAPRYVLGRGAVTRSHSASWFERHPSEQLTDEQLENIEEPTLPLVEASYIDAAAVLGVEDPKFGSSQYLEQRIVQARPSVNEFTDSNGNLINIYIKDNDNSTRVQDLFETLPVDPDEYPTAKDHRESRGASHASAGHYEHFEMSSNFTNYGDGFMDPDGIYNQGSSGQLGGYVQESSGNVPQFPWLNRNSRLPRYLASPYAPRSRFAYIYRNRKPTAFDLITLENNAGWDSNNRWAFSDKGVYAVDELPTFDDVNAASIYDRDSNGGYRYDENHLAPFSFQMNHKNGNFEQVGEVLNVWTHAHLVSQPYRDFEYPGQPQFIPRADPTVQAETIRTFSESLSRELDETVKAARGPISYKVQNQAASSNSGGIGSNPSADVYRYLYRPLMRDALRRVGRLEVSPNAYGRQQLVGEPVRDLASQDSTLGADTLQPWIIPNTDLSHLEPIQPAGQRVMDLFVCDGPGVYDLFNNEDYDNGSFGQPNSPDGIIDPEESYREYTSRDPSFMNAHGFTGKGTPGLVNINTATVEVLRTLPHMYRMVHGTGVNGQDILDGDNPLNRNPRVAVPEAMIQYRDQLGVHPTDVDIPTRSAPYVGAREPYLLDAEQSSLDSNSSGSVEAWEYGLNTGLDLGPSYAMRGAHTPVNHLSESPRTDMANLTLEYADRTDAGYDAFLDWTYDSDGIATGSGVRGFQGIGELFQLQSSGHRGNPFHTGLSQDQEVYTLQGDRIDPNAWSIEFAAKRPFMFSREGESAGAIDQYDDSPLQDNRFQFNDIGAAISTDTSTIRDTRGSGVQYLHGKPHSYNSVSTGDSRYRERALSGDMVAGDAEEANLLFSGLSNMITTRSDMFTVHFRVRTFKPNAETGVWDATDSDSIVDDSRFVMLVDRSEVEKAGDQPRIIYLEKIDN